MDIRLTAVLIGVDDPKLVMDMILDLFNSEEFIEKHPEITLIASSWDQIRGHASELKEREE